MCTYLFNWWISHLGEWLHHLAICPSQNSWNPGLFPFYLPLPIKSMTKSCGFVPWPSPFHQPVPLFRPLRPRIAAVPQLVSMPLVSSSLSQSVSNQSIPLSCWQSLSIFLYVQDEGPNSFLLFFRPCMIYSTFKSWFLSLKTCLAPALLNLVYHTEFYNSVPSLILFLQPRTFFP